MAAIEVFCWGERSFIFNLESTALLLIDMQRDFLAEDALFKSTASNPLSAAIPTVSRVLTASRHSGLRIIHTREGYCADGGDLTPYKRSLNYVGKLGPYGPYLIRGTRGHDFLDEFKPIDCEVVIDKSGFSAFYQTRLDQILAESKITHLILSGITTQCCVHSTLRDAVERGYFCLTLEDCCAAEDPTVHDATLRIIQAENHLFGWIAGADAFIAGLKYE